MLGEEAEDLVAAGAAPGAELEAALGEVVEHRDPSRRPWPGGSPGAAG